MHRSGCVPSLHGSCRDFCFCDERQTLLSLVSPLCVATSVMSAWASCGSWLLPPFPHAEGLLPAGRLYVQMDRYVWLVSGHVLNFSYVFTQMVYFQEAFFSYPRNCSPSTLFLLLPQTACLYPISGSVYLLLFCLLFAPDPPS